jgi:hypothetical protein
MYNSPKPVIKKLRLRIARVQIVQFTLYNHETITKVVKKHHTKKHLNRDNAKCILINSVVNIPSFLPHN